MDIVKNQYRKYTRKEEKPLTAYNLDKYQKRILIQPYLTVKGAAYILKKEAAKFNLNVPIQPSPNIIQHIKSDRDLVNPLDTAGVYRIKYTDENNKEGYYIGVTKQKINERLKEHQSDIKNSKNNTAIVRLALNQNIIK